MLNVIAIKIIKNKYLIPILILFCCINYFMIVSSKENLLTINSMFTIITTLLASFIGLIIADLKYYEKRIYAINNDIVYFIICSIIFFVLCFIYFVVYLIQTSNYNLDEFLIYMFLAFLSLIVNYLIVNIISVLKFSYNIHLVLCFTLTAIYMFFDVFFLNVEFLSILPTTIYETITTKYVNGLLDIKEMFYFIFDLLLLLFIYLTLIKLSKKGKV